ncbi:P-loop containing nucleoside triphosphate hydrolase protein [Metschnikowia bicuspidata var. bicuspidata NRRL YB-4993]|uniref:p-loop containing nucleoside triphosphate hydrolase protein n=1 Tax=Metschnikowia bicuspidata var. bicuspidata NRRL YB-4993 TaxID=869754 RepID=A0A1A0HCM8_9ASCO|nr:P-loop containing nucleoside triphosphate hydrolase protein [Metschnikowia bicuspidata var. bicuspidata NRRL YB-4993]OBA21751.1 P-loop containing nucleoside triphosphate hydrolase protein [Metschnikowia bicuspidata var. bicuspidata NRRL YB-4993]
MIFSGSEALHVLPSERVAILVNDLKVTVGPKDAESGTISILDSISFDLPHSNLMAIMGGSGSGKTTLLNVLAQRTNVNSASLKFSGSVTYSFPQTREKNRISTAYMVQEDFFMPGLTLGEVLKYQAELRLGNVTKEARSELIDTLLELLELDRRRNEIVKSFTGQVNLSGGEQRRLSLAIQLLSRPQVLFLDEPTTGLDTSSALTLVSVLKKLASPEIGITIILLIHQPRAEVMSLFDKLCVLTRGGRLVYFGSLAASTGFFTGLESTGMILKVDSARDSFSVFNKIMAVLVKDTTSIEKEIESSRITDALVQHWRAQHPSNCILSPSEQKQRFHENLKVFKPAEPLPLYKEISVLARRSTLISIRDKVSLLTLHGGGAILAVIVGWLFFKPDPNISGIRSITSSLYSLLEVIGISPLTMEVSRLWAADGIQFIKEYKERCVSIKGYVISRRLSKFFVEDVPLALIFSVITYFMWGLRLGDTYKDSGDGKYFGIYFTIILIVVICGMSLGLLCFALTSSFSLCLMLVNVVYQLQNSGCGYFVNAATMPVYVRWVKYIAFFWYAFGGLTSNQYTNWEGNCPYTSGSSECVEYTGDYQLEVLGFPQNWAGAAIGYLIAWLFGFNILTMIAFYFKSYDVEIAKKKKNRIGGESAEPHSLDLLLSASLSNEKDADMPSGPSIQTKNITLSVKVKSSQKMLAAKTPRVLLDNVTADFRSNSVNVIMGPSGGGKTTFLNFMASRLGNSSFSSSGQIFLNHCQEVKPSMLSKLSAYVTQTDNLLIPQLTVRETLYYQACLRLPVSYHKNIPMYLNELMRLTGLVDCADTPIGSESTKGISGGEKRRVSIAIQLLGKPRILFLDEPTSGLDSATSASILVLLKQLAQSGTTIITTLHQPSKEMFSQFDTLTLLARGGHVVYDGTTNSLPSYLASIGHQCPQHNNIADHILDLLSLKWGESADQLQARVEYLIQQWDDKVLLDEDQKIGLEINFKTIKRPEIPWYVLFKAVVSRQFVVSFRAVDILVARLWTVVALALIYAVFFSPLRNTQEGISNRLGLTQSIANLYFCGLVNNLSIYPSQRDLFHQEYKDNTYGVAIFHSAYFLVELPFEIIPSAFFSALVVFVIGLPRTPEMYFAIFFCSALSINCGEAAGIFFNSIFNHMGLVTNLLTNIFVVGLFMAGTMSLQMPEFFKAWNYINPAKYLVQICTNLGFKDQIFECADLTCSLNSGEAVLEEYGLEADLLSLFGAFVACLVVYRIISVSTAYFRVRYF